MIALLLYVEKFRSKIYLVRALCSSLDKDMNDTFFFCMVLELIDCTTFLCTFICNVDYLMVVVGGAKSEKYPFTNNFLFQEQNDSNCIVCELCDKLLTI